MKIEMRIGFDIDLSKEDVQELLLKALLEHDDAAIETLRFAIGDVEFDKNIELAGA